MPTIQEFVTQFAAAWAARDAKAFLRCGTRTVCCTTRSLDRPLKGSELGRLVETQNELAPDLVWQLLDWTSRGDVVIVEWQNTRFIDGKRMAYRGVDKFRFRDGKIIEERVYMDTAPLRARCERRSAGAADANLERHLVTAAPSCWSSQRLRSRPPP